MLTESKFNYDWTLKDANFTKDKGKVFSCFACGGGSTMGYKLAGFDVIGCNEIDKKMMEMYIENHHPKYSFLEPIQTFKNRDDLPEELYDLDILDGSFPCSAFSMGGNREKDWGKEKVFREGQSLQILDTLAFEFISLIKKLQPKIAIAENVEGLLFGKAIEYVHRIQKELDDAGYNSQYQLLDASTIGVPQARRRVFFFATRKDLFEDLLWDKNFGKYGSVPLLNMNFNMKKIKTKSFISGHSKRPTQNYSDKRFGDIMVNVNKPFQTITSGARFWLDKETIVDDKSLTLIGSFPIDYNFMKNTPTYVIGMSVPPVMMANIATQVYEQWLRELK